MDEGEAISSGAAEVVNVHGLGLPLPFTLRATEVDLSLLDSDRQIVYRELRLKGPAMDRVEGGFLLMF